MQFGFQFTRAKAGDENYQWLRIYEDVITPSSTVLRTELSIFSCSLRLAGQIDCICRDRNGKLVIWDWKRSKKIQMDSQQQMKAPLSHLPDCNFFAYALQDCVFRKYSAGGMRSYVFSARPTLKKRWRVERLPLHPGAWVGATSSPLLGWVTGRIGVYVVKDFPRRASTSWRLGRCTWALCTL